MSFRASGSPSWWPTRASSRSSSTEPVAGGQGGRRRARADRPRGRARSQAFNHLDKGDTFHGRQDRRARRAPTTTTAWCCRAASPTPTSCARTRTRCVRPRVLRGGQAGRRDLPRARGRWSRPTSSTAARSPRGRACRPTSATPAASGSTRRSTSTGLRHQPQARRPPRLLREGRRGVRRGRARGAARGDRRLVARGRSQQLERPARFDRR